jgi:CRISPR-associated endoribonuclease Cas6
MAFFIATVALMAGKGFGPRLARARLTEVTCLPTGSTIWRTGQQLGVVPDGAFVEPLQFDLRPCVGNLSRVCVRFLTPTELTAGGATVIKPDFATLFSRLRDRLSNLSAFYGTGPLDLDFRAMGERAAGIRLVKSDIRMIHSERTSGSTHQTHFLGGFVGEAEYEGELVEFVPFLQAGYWTGVGKKTPWGNGHIEIV